MKVPRDGSVEEVAVTRLTARAARGVRKPVVRRAAGAGVEITVSGRVPAPSARPWAESGSIDVEALVVWALRDQRADRHAGAGLNAIEAAVAGLEPRGRSADGCAAIADIQHMGCRVDASRRIVREHVHPAADAVAAGVEAVAGGWLVKHYGRLGVRPEGWAEPASWFRPVVWVKVGELGQWEWANEGRGERGGRITRVIPTITRDELARRRAEYTAWLEGLHQLAWRLSMRALGFTVTPPRAPASPWERCR